MNPLWYLNIFPRPYALTGWWKAFVCRWFHHGVRCSSGWPSAGRVLTHDINCLKCKAGYYIVWPNSPRAPTMPWGKWDRTKPATWDEAHKLEEARKQEEDAGRFRVSEIDDPEKTISGRAPDDLSVDVAQEAPFVPVPITVEIQDVKNQAKQVPAPGTASLVNARHAQEALARMNEQSARARQMDQALNDPMGMKFAAGIRNAAPSITELQREALDAIAAERDHLYAEITRLKTDNDRLRLDEVQYRRAHRQEIETVNEGRRAAAEGYRQAIREQAETFREEIEHLRHRLELEKAEVEKLRRSQPALDECYRELLMIVQYAGSNFRVDGYVWQFTHNTYARLKMLVQKVEDSRVP